MKASKPSRMRRRVAQRRQPVRPRPAPRAPPPAGALSLQEHNDRAGAAELAARIAAGGLVALVSDAGTPLVSDPGFALLRACHEAELPVEVLPGPSAVVTALVASGLPAERWCFAGFLPRARGELETLLAGATETLVAFESPRRLAATLALLPAPAPERPPPLCPELTQPPPACPP